MVVLFLGSLSCGSQGVAKPTQDSSIQDATVISRPFEHYWIMGEVRDTDGLVNAIINLYKNEELMLHSETEKGRFSVKLTKWQSLDFTHVEFTSYDHLPDVIPRDSIDFSNDTLRLDISLKPLPAEMDTIPKLLPPKFIDKDKYYKVDEGKK